MPPTEHNFLSSITGSFSKPAAENPTVAMIEAAYRQHGIDARYLNCEVAPADLAAAVAGAVAMGWVGFNCSIPHKVAVVDLVDELAESARIIGAVNCVVRRGSRLIGENTDGQGFLTSVRTVLDPTGQDVLMFGAGGAARAIAVELALAGCASITIVNRDQDRGAELAQRVTAATSVPTTCGRWTPKYAIAAAVGLVVNATSVGLFPAVDARLDVDPDTLRAGLVVADVIPNPPRTWLIREAEARGCIAVDGLGMLVNQGVISIGLWTGQDVDPAVMRATLAEIFAPEPGGEHARGTR